MANFYVKFDDIQHLETIQLRVFLKLVSCLEIKEKRIVETSINSILNDDYNEATAKDVVYALSELEDLGIVHFDQCLDTLDNYTGFDVHFADDVVIQKNAPRKKAT